jgi:4'-phosphopantetheinyl transferase
MRGAVLSESVRIYLLNGFDPKVSAEERTRVSQRFVADALRRYLEETGREIPEALLQNLRFVYGPHGKPFLADGALKDLFFSLSHTKGIAACAVSEKEIGCDIERPLTREMAPERLVKIAKRFFAPEEVEKLLPDPAGAFFPIWTKKEAYVKWTGRGLGEGLASFSVFDLPGHIVCENVTLRDAEDAVCAVCYAKEA